MKYFLGTLAAICLFFILPLFFYQQPTIFHVISYETNRLVDKTKDWNTATDEGLSYIGPARLFHDLVEDFLQFDEKPGHFVFDSRTGQITLPDCYSLEYLKYEEDEKTRQKILPTLNRLCKTDTGKSVQAEVEAWNKANTVVAIRDNLSDESDWKNIEWLSFKRVILGDHDELADSVATGIYHRAAKVAVDGNYGIMGQWNVLDHFSLPGEPVTFRQPINIKKGDVLHLQVVGKVDTVHFLDRSEQRYHEQFVSRILATSQDEQSRRNCNLETALSKRSLSSSGLRFAQVQTYFSKVAPCALSDGNTTSVNLKDPVLTFLTFDFRQLDVSAISKMELTVVAERAIPPRIARLKNARKSGDTSSELQRLESAARSPNIRPDGQTRSRKVHQSGNIELRCKTKPKGYSARSEFNQTDECWLAWAGGGVSTSDFPSVAQNQNKVSKPDFNIFANDGTTVLASRKANCPDCDASWVTNAADDWGMTAWLGHSKIDLAGLSNVYEAHVNASGSPAELRLTLDKHLQQKTESVLEQIVEKKFTNFGEFLPAENDKDRLISVMLLNGKGEILSSANWPRAKLSDEVNYWDVVALEDNGYDYLSPLAMRGWSALNQTMQPGSTFKVISSLALLQAVSDAMGLDESSGVRTTDKESTDRVFDVVKGVNAAALKNKMGIRKCKKTYDGKKKSVDCLDYLTALSNSSGTPFTDHAANSKFQVTCSFDTAFRSANAVPTTDEIGLREAFAKSSNIWFGGTVKNSDLMGFSITDIDHPFRKVINRLNMSDITNNTLIPYSNFGELTANRVRPQSIVADFQSIRTDRKFLAPEYEGAFVKALIGQQVQASPLVMTALMASVAKGHIVRPTLTVNRRNTGEEKTPLLSNTSARLADLLLNELRCAMQGVVNKGGTAAIPFASLEKKILEGLYAKTGTAQTEGTKLFVGSLSGYQIGILPNEPLAFSCMISHSTKPGGSVCGPVIKELLEQIIQ